MAGLCYGVHYNRKCRSVVLNICGFSDKQIIFSKKGMHTLATLPVNQDSFHMLEKDYLHGLYTSNYDRSEEHPDHTITCIKTFNDHNANRFLRNYLFSTLVSQFTETTHTYVNIYCLEVITIIAVQNET